MSDDEKNRDNDSFEEFDQKNSDDEKMRENEDDEKIRENNDDDQIKLFIKDVNANDTMITCSPSEKISRVKELIAEKLNIKPDLQRLTYINKPLDDDKTLFDYDIQSNNTIHLTRRLHGGLI